jgi:hypothetical protein
LGADQVSAPEKMPFPAVEFPAVACLPLHLKMISLAALHPHALKTFKPHPRLTASFEERLFGRENLSECLY